MVSYFAAKIFIKNVKEICKTMKMVTILLMSKTSHEFTNSLIHWGTYEENLSQWTNVCTMFFTTVTVAYALCLKMNILNTNKWFSCNLCYVKVSSAFPGYIISLLWFDDSISPYKSFSWWLKTIRHLLDKSDLWYTYIVSYTDIYPSYIIQYIIQYITKRLFFPPPAVIELNNSVVRPITQPICTGVYMCQNRIYQRQIDQQNWCSGHCLVQCWTTPGQFLWQFDWSCELPGIMWHYWCNH